MVCTLPVSLIMGFTVQRAVARHRTEKETFWNEDVNRSRTAL